MKVYTFDNKVLTHDNKWLKEAAAPGPSTEVTIGSQIWKTENLAIHDGGSGIYTFVPVINDVTYPTQYYYTLAAATRIVNNISGWHIPTKTEFETLLANYNDATAAIEALCNPDAFMSYLQQAVKPTNSSGFNAYGFNEYNISAGNIGENEWGRYDGSWVTLMSSTYDTEDSEGWGGDYYYRLNLAPSTYEGNKAEIATITYNEAAAPVRLIKDS